MRYVGVDLHKTLIVACYLEDEKSDIKSFKIEDLAKFKQSLVPTDELCFEETTNSSWFYRECKGLVSGIIVVNTSEFAVIARSVKKMDKNDAKTLAIHLSKGMLPEVRVKSQCQQDIETLFNARKLLTKETTMLKNELHGILLSQGININPNVLNSEVGLNRIAKMCNNSEINFALISLTEALKSLDIQIKGFDQKLQEFGSKLPGYENLKSIYGLGTNAIALLLATIGNINNFANHSKLASYIGLIPSVRNSNQSTSHGRITKRGNSLLRGNLVMCALVAKGKNKELNDFYTRIKLKNGYKNAIVATAHKLVKIVYYTLKYNWCFVNFCAKERNTLIINWQ